MPGGAFCLLVDEPPAGMEAFFREAGAPHPDAEPDLRAALAAAVRHGWEFAGRSPR